MILLQQALLQIMFHAAVMGNVYSKGTCIKESKSEKCEAVSSFAVILRLILLPIFALIILMLAQHLVSFLE